MRGQQLRKCMVPHGKLNLLDWKMLPGVFQFFVSFHPSLLFMAHLINLIDTFYCLLFISTVKSPLSCFVYFNGDVTCIKYNIRSNASSRTLKVKRYFSDKSF